MWSVADAKAQLSEVLRRARAGDPQFVGTREPCVVISAALYERAVAPPRGHDGAWLIGRAAAIGAEIPLPPRDQDRAGPDVEAGAFGTGA